MRKALCLALALGLVVGFGGLAFAGGDSGMCEYSSYSKQLAAKKTDTQQPAVTEAQQDESTKLVLAQTEKSTKPVDEAKK